MEGMTIGIIGLGLIGGSFAKAVKALTPHRVLALDTNPEVCRRALESGAADEIISPDALSRCDVVIVALYPGLTVRFILENLARFKPGAVIMDVCGVKRFVCAQLTEAARDAGVHFVGAHPMAGKETAGFENAHARLFENASLILMEDADAGALETVRALGESLGFSKSVLTTPEMHDEIIALTSQLAHIISNAFVKSPTAKRQAGFSAGSFQDLTRVAQLNEAMWSELFLLNRDYLTNELTLFIENVRQVRDAIAFDDAPTLCRLLRDGSDTKKSITSAALPAEPLR